MASSLWSTKMRTSRSSQRLAQRLIHSRATSSGSFTMPRERMKREFTAPTLWAKPW